MNNYSLSRFQIFADLIERKTFLNTPQPSSESSAAENFLNS